MIEKLDEEHQRWAREQFESVPDAKAILELFIEWANSYEKDESLKLEYNQFFEWERLTRVEFDISINGYGRWLQITAGNGDEGGSSDLMAYFERREDRGEWELQDITHRFDLTADVIWRSIGGGFVKN